MFGIGSSKQSSQSSSNEYGYSIDGSSSDSFSRGTSQSTSGSTGRSFTDVAFSDIFASLYGNASGAAGRMAAQAPGFSEQAQQLFSGGMSFLDELGGGSDYLDSRLSSENPVLQQQIDALGGDLGKFFREELNPAITSSAVMSGTLGGGRQGVAQGKATEAVGREFQRGALELRAADVASRDAIASTLLANRTQAAGAGLNALPGLAGIAEAGFGAELAPWEALAGILGGPTTLAGSEQSSFSQSTAEDIARAIAESFGTAENWASSQSSSKGKSFNLSAGK